MVLVLPHTRTRDTLASAQRARAAVQSAEIALITAAYEWAWLHEAGKGRVIGLSQEVPQPGIHEDEFHPSDVTHLGATRLKVWEFAAAELALALCTSDFQARRMMGDAVDLWHRLPITRAAMAAGQIPVWVARRIATLTHRLTDAQAAEVDQELTAAFDLPISRLLTVAAARVTAVAEAAADAEADHMATQRFVRFARNVEGGTRGLAARLDAADALRLADTLEALTDRLADAEPERSRDQLAAAALGLLSNPALAAGVLAGEPTKAPRPQTTLYVHVTPETLSGDPDGGVARVEQLGAWTRQMLVYLLGHEHITVKPVIDLRQAERAADCYETPAAIAERVHLIRPADYFPYAPSVTRRADLDHVVPFDPGGPPGQTRADNLGLLIRRHHRIKTHAGWSVTPLDGQRFSWTSPHGQVVITGPHGTRKATWDDYRFVDYTRIA